MSLDINMDDYINYEKAYSDRLQNVRIEKGKLWALCPFHNDKHNTNFNVNLRSGQFYCFACNVSGNYIKFRAMSDRINTKEATILICKENNIPVQDTNKKSLNNKSETNICKPYSLEEYSKDKNIPVDFLKKYFFLSDTQYGKTPVLQIPYFDDKGKFIRNRVRFGKGSTNRFKWLEQSDSNYKTFLYSSQFLQNINNYQINSPIIVEGESDVHTLTYNGFCAVGIAGATLFKKEYANLFNIQGINEIFIHIECTENEEPDEGGKIILKDIPQKLRAGGYSGKIYSFSCRDRGAKDPSELYNILNHNKNDFFIAMSELLGTAEEILINNEPITNTDNNTIDIIPPAPQYTKYDEKGKLIKKHIDNFKAFLDFLQLSCKYNLLTKEIEITDSKGNNPFFDLDEASTDIASLSLEHELNLSNKSVLDFLGALAKKNRYNPVADYLKSNYLSFSNKSEIDLAEGAEITKLFDCLKIEYDENNTISEKLQRKTLYKTLFVKWLIGAYMIAFNNGAFGCAGILVLKGRQGIGKTRFLNTLCVNESWGYDGLCLDPTNKDSVLSATRYWIVELGEIGQTLQKRTLNALKAFITSPMDDIRLPYGRSSARYPRQTAYLGTVNDDRFLRDETGERRYWVIPLENIEGTEAVNINRVWAEVGYLVENKSIVHYLDSKEIDQLNNMNEAFHRGTTEENLLLDRLDLENTNILEYKSYRLSEIAIQLGLSLTSISALGKAIKRIQIMFPELPIQIPTNNKNRIYKIPPFKNDPFQAFSE